MGSVGEQRLAFVELVASGVGKGEACARFGISRPTGNKWLARYRAEGEDGLADRSRRPGSSPEMTNLELEELVCGVRDRFPAWGGRKIRGFLLRQGQLGVPAPSTVTQILRRYGYLAATPPARARYEKVGSFQADAPNDLWQIDFKGHFALGDGRRCHPLGILDDHSRFNLCLQACRDEKTTTVKAHLEVVFSQYGIPVRFLADNGPPWGNTQTGFRWTPLSVWLLDHGIGMIHSRPRHPQTVGKEERFHLTLDIEVLSQHHWEHLNQVQDAFDSWRPIYNHQRPHQALGETVVPADRYRPSPRPYQPPTPIDYPPGWTVRTVDANASITYQSQTRRVGKPFIGRPVAINPDTNTIYYRTTPIRTDVNHDPERV